MQSGGEDRSRRAVTRSVVIALALSLLAPAVALVDPPSAQGATCYLKVSRADTRRLRTMRTSRPRVLSRPSAVRDLAELTLNDPAAGQRRTELRRAANRLVGLTPPEIGRASWRERVLISRVAVTASVI